MKQAKLCGYIRTASVAVVTLVFTLLSGTTLYAADDINKRLQRLEHIANNRQQFDLVNQVMELQQVVETLRGQVDLQTRILHELTERQQLYFQDVDQRLAALEAGKKGSTGKNSKPIVAPQRLNSGAAATTRSPPTVALPAPSIPAPAMVTPIKPPVAQTAKNTGSDQQDQAAYQQAYQYLLDKNYDQAIVAFEHYLQNYPQGTFRANAHYWLGEVYLLNNQAQQAQQAFNKVLSDYPQNSKAGDALLKLGYAYVALGDRVQAKTVFNRVLQQYPQTSLARLAQTRLAEL